MKDPIEIIRSWYQVLVCSMTNKRCVFCEREVCAIYPNGNPFKDTEYKKAMEHFEQIRKGEGK